MHVAGGGAALWHSQAVIGAAMHQPKTELPTSTELIVSICQYADTANYRYCSPNWLLLSTVGLVARGSICVSTFTRSVAVCWCWWCCVLIVCLYLKWYFYLGLSQLPARRPAKNYQAHKNKCARATGHQPAPGAGGGYITVCSRHPLQQQQHSSQGL